MEAQTENIMAGAKVLADKFMDNFVRPKGWRLFLQVMFGHWSLTRRILGGKWELWGHDMGEINAVLSWHWVKDWSDTLTSGEHIVAKRVYRGGRSLSSTTVLLESLERKQVVE